LLISTKGGYGFQATSASNHGLAGITANATKAGVLATHNGPRGSGAALVANGRNNVGASIYNNLTNAPALVVKATQNISELERATAIRAVSRSLRSVAVEALSEGGTAVDGYAFSQSTWAEVTGGSFIAHQNVPGFPAYGVFAEASTVDEDGIPIPGTAIAAVGNVNVNGTLTKSGGSFRIDHPLDPADKYLSHSFVESPDMKNIYDGVAIADWDGEAKVELPEWFEALNKDFRYQLTPIGPAASELRIGTEIEDNTFRIAGAQPGQRISWQVTGTRKDAWANANRIPVEHDKPANEKGSYLFPEGFGRPQADSLQARYPHPLR
jgi:hypothetical protein